jgi:hypothetical protein
VVEEEQDGVQPPEGQQDRVVEVSGKLQPPEVMVK